MEHSYNNFYFCREILNRLDKSSNDVIDAIRETGDSSLAFALLAEIQQEQRLIDEEQLMIH
jgi:hypothetical protein